MEDKSTTNLSRLEKIVITVYILYVLFDHFNCNDYINVLHCMER